MQSIVKKLLTSSLLLCLPLLAGCGKDGNPMAPKADTTPPPTEYLDVTVTLVRLFAVADGDILLDGPGDFTFRAIVTGGGTELNVSGSPEIETGNSYVMNMPKVFRVPKGQNAQIKVSFTATEWDNDILGNTWPDSRMNNLNEFRIHSDATPSASFNDGERWITLGEGDLRLRLIYNIVSRPVS